jgi:hypothetical protein
MARDGLLPAIRWIQVNIVPATMAMQQTALPQQQLDELTALHTAISLR